MRKEFPLGSLLNRTRGRLCPVDEPVHQALPQFVAMRLPNAKNGHAQHAFGAFKRSFAQVPPFLLLVFVQVRCLLAERRIGVRTVPIEQASAQGWNTKHLVKIHRHRIGLFDALQRGLVAFRKDLRRSMGAVHVEPEVVLLRKRSEHFQIVKRSR